MKFLSIGCASFALAAVSPALAQAPSEEELPALVRAQAAEIASLKARLDKLEAREASAQPPVLAAAPSPSPAPTGSRPPRAVAVTTPYAPQIVPPGPAERDIRRAQEANAAGVTTEWGAGLPVFHSADGNFTFKPRGRILADVSSTFGSRYKDRNLTVTGMRALRMGVEGGVGTQFFYQFETDFSENEVDIVTAFIGWRGRIAKSLDYDVRAGHLFNDRAFEGSTGSDSTPFLERSTVSTAIIPQRGFYGIGIMPRLFWKTAHASLTLTGDRVDGNQTTSDSRTVLARAHWNPIKADRGVLHLGLWGFDEHLSEAATALTRNTVIGGRFNGALRVSSGTLTGGTGTTGYGAELGGYAGPVWIMAEAGQRHARLDNDRPDFVSKAWSVSGGWFVTGDLPPYNPRLGSFGQPTVLSPIFEGGPGAIELTARYESLDYTDILSGGQGWAATVGANWYLNSFTRLQLNAIHWNTDNRAGAFVGSDKGQTISTRIGVTF
ncbi:OprO/OprP family phosphate-selective porin [Novosphingobium sp. 9U]|uniref:OprO/OprP family phosphate-selective porin n=1 Tax=Novosphingobium sp. 9U TaxID=2653158 RepID=UPI0012F3016F|nr:porin [Novosphingobium sp. 9U]VWX46747.1 Phosphate-specific outer membrane porin OprP; Pyrophosphate-specific outer membrane porin OprO [Novosphingobium sp. 9U]